MRPQTNIRLVLLFAAVSLFIIRCVDETTDCPELNPVMQGEFEIQDIGYRTTAGAAELIPVNAQGTVEIDDDYVTIRYVDEDSVDWTVVYDIIGVGISGLGGDDYVEWREGYSSCE